MTNLCKVLNNIKLSDNEGGPNISKCKYPVNSVILSVDICLLQSDTIECISDTCVYFVFDLLFCLAL